LVTLWSDALDERVGATGYQCAPQRAHRYPGSGRYQCARPQKSKGYAGEKDLQEETCGRGTKTVPLVPGPAVVEANNVNVRGQSKLKSEIVTRLTNGQPVMVIEEITHNNSGPDEPSAWAKIALPPGAHVWVNTAYIDATNKTVLPKKLNLRSGPAERFSVIGTLQRGESVKALETKGEWTEIEAPSSAYAFVAAQYLRQEAPGALAAAPAQPAAATTEPAPPPTTVNEPPPIAAPPTEPPSTPTPTPTEAVTNAATEVASTQAAPPTPAADEPPPKRIVQREGMVRGTFSIQAPTRFELVSPQNGRTMDYLYTTSPNLDLRRYKGLRIVVTGEEGLEERWGNTPVITIQKIQVLE
jgi:uncharacterized protein YgiM (DUF1202 family)